MTASRPAPNWKRLDELDVPSGSPFLIDGLVHATSTTIFGRPGSGKGWLAESLAWSFRNSKTWFGRDVVGSNDVAFWPLDPGQRPELKNRAQGLTGILPFIPDERPDLTVDGFCDFADDLMKADVGLLIVDNLFRLMPANTSIRNDEQVRVVLDKLDKITTKGIALVLVHHAGKPGEQGTPKTPIGSTIIEAWSRHFLRVEQDKSDLVTITSYGNNSSPFAIKTRIDPSVRGDTPFFADPVETKSHERDGSRLDEGRKVGLHLAQIGSFASVSAAAKYLVSSAPEGMAPKSESAWRACIERKVLGAGFYVKPGGRRIEPNLERLQ